MLGNVNFRRYWFSGVLNAFGGQITALAMPLCAVLLLHATPGQMGLLTAAYVLPFALFALPMGVWLDRRTKFPIVLGCEIMYAVALGSVPAAYWLGILSMPWLYTVAFLVGTGLMAGGTAQQIFLTHMVGRDKLIDAQSKFAVTDSAAKLLAPGIAGVLVQWLTAPFAILVDAAAFVLSWLNLRQIRVAETAPAPTDKHPLHDMKVGLAFVWGQPLLRSMAWGSGVWNFLFNGYCALIILYATQNLGMSPGTIGTAQMLGGIGILASSFLLKPLTKALGAGTTILIGLSGTATVFLLVPLLPPALLGSPAATAIAYGCLVCLYDCSVMLFLMPYVSLRQSVTPDELLGRMVSTMRFLTIATAPLGALVGGYIGSQFGVRTGLACVAAGGVALSLQMFLFSPVRGART